MALAQNVGNWNFLLSAAGIPGFGLFVDAPVASSVNQATLEVFVDGSSTAAVTRTLDLTASTQEVSIRKQDAVGKDIGARLTFYTTVRRQIVGSHEQALEMEVELKNRGRRVP